MGLAGKVTAVTGTGRGIDLASAYEGAEVATAGRERSSIWPSDHVLQMTASGGAAVHPSR
jgi:hypothetical protein